MPSAAGSTDPAVSAATSRGSAASISSTGSRHPITPVELGRTSGGRKPSSRAVAAHNRSAASTPPGAQTLEILLFTRIAPSAGSASRRRPMRTGAPGKAFRVKTAAKSGVGRSSAMRVSVISAGLGTSRGVKAKRVVPTRKPAGNPACVASQARCTGREEKTLAVLGTLRQVGRTRAGVKLKLRDRAGAERAKFLMENAHRNCCMHSAPSSLRERHHEHRHRHLRD